MPPVRNLLFDFGNVLIDIDVAATKARMETFLRRELAEGHGVEMLTALVHSYETNQLSSDQFVEQIIQLSKPWIEASDVIDAWNGMLLELPARRLQMLSELRKQYNVLMLSNTNELHISWVHNYLKAIHKVSDFENTFFHKVYYSHHIGFRKPHAEAFQFVIKDSDIVPGETLFIDDMEENIRAANSLGFQTRLFSGHEEIVEVMEKMGFTS